MRPFMLALCSVIMAYHLSDICSAADVSREQVSNNQTFSCPDSALDTERQHVRLNTTQYVAAMESPIQVSAVYARLC